MKNERLYRVEDRISKDMKDLGDRITKIKTVKNTSDKAPFIMVLYRKTIDGLTGAEIFYNLLTEASYAKDPFGSLPPSWKLITNGYDDNANDVFNAVKDAEDKNKDIKEDNDTITDIIILGLSINDEVREAIDNRLNDDNDPLRTCVLIDYHPSNYSPNLKDWEYIKPCDIKGLKTCKTTTQLFFELCCKRIFYRTWFSEKIMTKCKELSSIISIYESGAYRDKEFNESIYNFNASEKFSYINNFSNENEDELYESKGMSMLSKYAHILNRYFEIVGIELYSNKLNEWIKDNDLYLLDSEVITLCEKSPDIVDKLCELCANNYRARRLICYGKAYNVAFCFADVYQYEIGNYICEQQEAADLCMLLSNDKKLTLVTKKEDINLKSMVRMFKDSVGCNDYVQFSISGEDVISLLANTEISFIIGVLSDRRIGSVI